MASSNNLSHISDDINANIKTLWPDKDLEIDYRTDDHETYYADLLELCGDLHSREGQRFRPFYCDAYGAIGMDKATEKLHRMIKQNLAKKLASEANAGGTKGKQ